MQSLSRELHGIVQSFGLITPLNSFNIYMLCYVCVCVCVCVCVRVCVCVCVCVLV